MNNRFKNFTTKYSRIIVAVILILLLVIAGVLKFEQARSVGKGSDTEATKAEETTGSSGKIEDQEAEYEPETRIKIMNINGSEATVVLFSTTELEEGRNYDLYAIEKRDGEWVRDSYIRTIHIPSAEKTRKGKYRYYSDAVSVDWLTEGTIYQLVPHDEGNNHSSVPFWTRLT